MGSDDALRQSENAATPQSLSHVDLCRRRHGLDLRPGVLVFRFQIIVVITDAAPEQRRNGESNLIEKRIIYWMITAERP